MLDYRAGFKSLETECAPTNLTVIGKIPAWLKGSLLRNGPAKFDIGTHRLNHWFDGFALLHRFLFADGKVDYSSKFLESIAFKKAIEKQKLCSEEFASKPDNNVLKRILTSNTIISDNTNVNVGFFENISFAMTETTNQIQFNPISLKTINPLVYNDNIAGQLTTPHPHYICETKEIYNFTIQIGLQCFYNLYRWKIGSDKRDLICSIPTKTPGYFHSFGMTKDYIILIEQPLILNKLKLLVSNLPYIKNYDWLPDRGACFIVIDRHSGTVVLREYTNPFFTFHHVNAYQTNSNEILLDVVAFEDPGIINSFYLKNIEKMLDIPKSTLKRFHINLKEKTINNTILSSSFLEFSRIHYQEFNAKFYQVLYATGLSKNAPFFNQLIKLNVESGVEKIWFEDYCYPGEPIFVPKVEKTEEEGVVLSVVLDTQKELSYLLILDAKSFTEIARAYLPHIMPFGLHGQFSR